MRQDESGVCLRDEQLKNAVARIPRLSRRELEVLLALPSGHTNGALAQRLCMTERTVRAHIGQILIKLDIEGRVRAAVVAYAWQNCCRENELQ